MRNRLVDFGRSRRSLGPRMSGSRCLTKDKKVLCFEKERGWNNDASRAGGAGRLIWKQDWQQMKRCSFTSQLSDEEGQAGGSGTGGIFLPRRLVEPKAAALIHLIGLGVQGPDFCTRHAGCEGRPLRLCVCRGSCTRTKQVEDDFGDGELAAALVGPGSGLGKCGL